MELKKLGIKTALDTCGFCSKESLEKILPYTDIVLYDLKEIDPVKHKEYTGFSNEKILANLIDLAEYSEHHDSPPEIWIRTPIIPGTTDNETNILGIGKFIAKRYNTSEANFYHWMKKHGIMKKTSKKV